MLIYQKELEPHSREAQEMLVESRHLSFFNITKCRKYEELEAQSGHIDILGR